MAVVEFFEVDVIFGPRPQVALALLDAGEDRASILEKTGSVVGVAGASLAVQKGQICVLMGLSGSGKSSLLRCVNGLNQVTRGKLTVQHGEQTINVVQCGERTLRDLRSKRIAMVFQQFGLLPWRTVRANVGLGLELRGMPKLEIDRIVDEKLALVHLEQWAEKSVDELSGGMQQRVGLARAFATDADILLMDEPFSALDPLIRDHLQDELLELQRDLRKTIIFVSHDLDEALKLGNHIVIMDNGRIVQQGKAEDIVFQPANEYVRKFVANMNPLHVLYARALMQPLAELKTSGTNLRLDEELELELDDQNILVQARLAGNPCQIVPIGELVAGQPLQNRVVAADSDTDMRSLVAARRQLAQPILVMEGGRLLGVIGEPQLLDGLLRQGSQDT
ncbi:MAG TPA: choline ABC transporter ATP-binding protein [Gammaproteobacteria bacterium]|nr:choline ABC transporter ATP-binding protein [Gammaproteobacteria bacterium]